MTAAALTYLSQTPKGMIPARLVTQDGCTLAFRTYPARGAAWGRVLVLHGMGLNAQLYGTLAGLLAGRGLDVVLMDFRGHGDSGGPQGAAPHKHAYRDDLRAAINAFSTDDLPLFLYTHSGSAVAAMDLLSQPDAPRITGYAMVTPTISGDTELTRAGAAKRDVGAWARTLLRFRPERVLSFDDAEMRMAFNFPKFMLARLTRLTGWLRPLQFIAKRGDQPPFVYTARAAMNMITTWPDTYLSGLRGPMFLATAQQDPFVNGEALATRLPWVLGPDVALTYTVLPRGDHFTATLFVVPALLEWLQAQVPPVAAADAPLTEQVA